MSETTLAPGVPGSGEDNNSNDDSMLTWIQQRINIASFDLKLWQEEHSQITACFLTDSSIKSIFATVDQETHVLIVCCDSPPQQTPGRIDLAYFVRPEGQELTISNISDVLIFGTFAMKQTPSSVINVMENVLYPHIFYTREWNESSRTELMGLYHRYLASLTESLTEEIGKTVLYLPFKNEEKLGLEIDFTNKSTLQQFESIAIHWIRQIKGVLNNVDGDHGLVTESQGPIEELHFWKSRADDLRSILEQLESDAVKKIIRILKSVSSNYAKPVEALSQLIERGSHEAESIVKFIQVLEEPCKKLSFLEPNETPTIYPQLLNCTRMIYTLSSNYSTYERISGLLRRISTEIIRQCSSHISIKGVLYGNVSNSCAILKDCIDCGKKWKHLYNRTAVTVNQHIDETQSLRDKWNFNDASIFAEVDAFVQRCDDLLEICQGRKQFISVIEGDIDVEGEEKKVIFGGSNGSEIEQSLKTVSKTFIGQIERLSNLQYDILDAKAMQWHSDFSTFRAATKDLDNMMVGVINSSFESIQVIAAAAHLLQVFRKYSLRQSVWQCWNNKAIDLLGLFSGKCNTIRQEFETLHRNPPLRKNEPYYAGAALWSRALRSIIEKDWDVIEEATLFAQIPKSTRDDVETSYEQLTAALRAYQKQKYTDWLSTLQGIDSIFFQERLDMAVLKREENELDQQNHYFRVATNFDLDIIKIFTEAHFWDKLHDENFVAPNAILGICHRREILRVLREKVMMLVRTFNDFLEDIDGNHGLYSDHIRKLEKKIQPAFSKLTWSSRPVVIERFVQTSIEEIQIAHLHINDFHRRMHVVTKQCQTLASISLICIDKNKTYEDLEFEKEQSEHRAFSQNLFVKCHEKILYELDHLLNQFRGGSVEVKREWELHVSRIEDQIMAALSQSVKSSLRELINIVDSPTNTGDTCSVFTSRIELKNGKIECRPSMINITHAVNKLTKELIGISRFVPRLLPKLEPKSKNGSPHYFYDQISSDTDVLQSVVRIMNGMAKSSGAVQRKVKTWEQFKGLWEMDKDSFLRKYSKSSRPLEAFDRDISRFKEQQSLIHSQKSTYSANVVELNFSGLKTNLKKLSTEFQVKLIELLNDETVSSLKTIHEYLDHNFYKIGRQMRTICDLRDTMQLIKSMKKEKGNIENQFHQLQNAHVTLLKFNATVDVDSNMMLENLMPRFISLLEQISISEGFIENAKVNMKSDLQKMISKHRDRLVELCSKIEDLFADGKLVSMEDALHHLYNVTKHLKAKEVKEQELQPGLELFQMDVQEVKGFARAEEQVKVMNQVVSIASSWNLQWEDWLCAPIANLSYSTMGDFAERSLKNLMRMPLDVRNWGIWGQIRDRIEEFKILLPLIQDLKNQGMRKRHWDEVGRVIGKDFCLDKNEFTLNDVFLTGLQKHKSIISDLAENASKEFTIEETLAQMRKKFREVNVEIVSYKDTFRIKSTIDVFSMIEDDNVTLASIKASRIGRSFQVEVESHERNLNSLSELLESLLKLQKSWLYLENIFMGTGDIMNQLPREHASFSLINNQFKGLMTRVSLTTCVHDFCTNAPTTLQTLTEMLVDLELIQKSLDQYLEIKRTVFPRFYFISDEDLLDILGKSKEPEKVQKHFKKCFEGINELLMTTEHGSGETFATGAIARDGEVLNFVHQIKLEGTIELWLLRIVNAMKDGLKNALHGCVNSLKASTKEAWVVNWHGQVLITAGAIYMTKSCTRALDLISSGKDRHALRSCKKRQISHLRHLTDMIRDPSLGNVNRSKITALITMEVHNRDVIDTLIKKGCTESEDFSWLSKLRFYLDRSSDHGSCMVKQTHCVLPYSYEYQGNNGRLVVTPLTDRCVLTLITALYLHRGGNPLGPAGTGKTETVKDLAKNLGYYCIVTNCSEEMDYKSIGRILSGLCQSGSWGCFDEFNRIRIEVLSVVAMQVSSIFNTLASRQKMFLFMDSRIKCLSETGIFITMNPGYAGRTELPDNLKAMMRPIAMMSPDLVLIAEVILAAEGFVHSRSLSKKVIAAYELMQQQLSKQSHYDYGLRNIKATLNMAWALQRKGRVKDEEFIIISAIRAINKPKFTKSDLHLFECIMNDLFPEKCSNIEERVPLQNAIETVFASDNLQPNLFLEHKCLQLADAQQTRHCNMLVGGSLTGKSTIWATLSKAKRMVKEEDDHFAKQVESFIINPKAQSTSELYGSYDLSTYEWNDGVFSSIFRRCAEDEEEGVEKWIIFDGPVDAIWIESMNSVMDDNKILTLINGDRINLTSSMSLLFEVEDLLVASPATVSRAGMIYVDSNLGWEPFLQSWLEEQLSDDMERRTTVEALCQKYLNPLLQCKEESDDEPIPISSFSSVRAFLAMYETFLKQLKERGSSFSSHSDIEKLCIFCLAWSVGGTADEKGRFRIDSCLREIDSRLMPTRSIYDYFIDPKTGEFEVWEVKEEARKQGINPVAFHDILVPTLDTVRYLQIIQSLIDNNHRVLVSGPTGSGKSCLLKCLMRKLPEHIAQQTINLSWSTESGDIQSLFERNVEKRSKNKFGPINGRTKLLIFVDDFNMPRKTSKESPYQPSLEFIRHFMGYSGYYDRKSCSWHEVINTDILAAMSPPGRGREMISNRILSQFVTLNYVHPGPKEVTSIFHSILSSRMKSLDSGIKSIMKDLAESTSDILHKVIDVFRPTPLKTHYIFNLRDVMRVAQGLLQADHSYIDSREYMLRLWAHECTRSFSDRFVQDTSKDEETFIEILHTILRRRFSYDFSGLNIEAFSKKNELLFTSVSLESLEDVVVDGYKEVKNKATLLTTISKLLKEYNDHQALTPMRLVLFDQALTHICRIQRVLQMRRGHALLIGVGGSGRESLTRLACFISKLHFFSIRISKEYGKSDFIEDVKSVCKRCGLDNKGITFFIKDSDIKHEHFLEIINGLLVSEELINLFNKEEVAEICDDIRKEALLSGTLDAPELFWQFFTTRVKANLHVCIAFSPIGGALSARFRVCPGFINCMTINWFHNWPTQALEAVAHEVLRDHDIISTKYTGKIARSFAAIHETVVDASTTMATKIQRLNYITPSNYLDLIRGYCSLFKNKSSELGVHEKKLSNGLEKLANGRAQVEEMRISLEKKRMVVNESQRNCEQLLEKIVADKRAAKDGQNAVELESKRIQKEKIECESIASEAKTELAIALPALEEALAQVEKLDKSSITEIKAYSNPPSAVEKVLSCVMIFFGKPTTWSSARKALGETNFLSNLKGFDKENIKESTLSKVRKYIKNPSFAAEEIFKVSQAAGALCVWCHATYLYAGVVREVAPKRARLKEAQKSLNEKQNDLQKSMQELEIAKSRMNELKQKYDESVRGKNDLKTEAKKLENNLKRAENLINGLQAEYSRWAESKGSLKEKLHGLVGDTVVASAFLSYAGPFDSIYRSGLLYRWNSLVDKEKLQRSQSFSLPSFLSCNAEIRKWNLQGLAKDSFSIENAIIIKKSIRWPLLIDPQNQAGRWIKAMEGMSLKILDHNMKDYIKEMENAVSFGIPVLLQKAKEHLDPSIESILYQSENEARKAHVVRFGGEEVDCHKNFRLYITTDLPNPHYLPEVTSKATVINFSVKDKGLEEQLLAVIVNEEQPNLESQKNSLVVSIAHGKERLIELEDSILQLLSNSTGNLLDDKHLINTLEKSKQISSDVKDQLKTSQENEKEIDIARDVYRKSARQATIMYFSINDMTSIDPMYEYSLDSYLEMFKTNIVRSCNDDDFRASKIKAVEDRADQINKYHLLSVYRSTCVGLFSKDKLLFSLQLCIRIMKEDKSVKDEFDFFCYGKVYTKKAETTVSTPNLQWLSEIENKALLDLNILIDGIVNCMSDHEAVWIEWYHSDQPEIDTLPKNWEKKVSRLQKLCLIRALRLDRVIHASTHFVSQILGSSFTCSPPLDLDNIFSQSSTTVPLIFILSPGVDPTEQIKSLAELHGKSLTQISLGQGQATVAVQALNHAVDVGSWVFLANCHLMMSWMPYLETLMEKYSEKGINENFRLWLSSRPDPDFPMSILQKGIKMTTEKPRGLRSNLEKLYGLISVKNFDCCKRKTIYSKLFFCLSWFHSILLERGKFKSLGFSASYEFNDSDFLICNDLIKVLLEEYPKKIPFDALKYLIGEAYYGGRVTDDWDRKILNVYMDSFFSKGAVEEENFKLSLLEEYSVPNDSTFSSHVSYIQQLPSFDNPCLFGQHPNAELSSQILEANILLQSLAMLQPDHECLNSTIPEETSIPEELSFTTFDGLPDIISSDEVNLYLQRSLDADAIKTVLVHEVENYNMILSIVHETTQNLKEAMKGQILMTPELERTIAFLLQNRVPLEWLQIYHSSKPFDSWKRDICRRIEHFTSWIKVGAPKVFWLPGFTNPIGFLTAVLQTFARSKHVPIDSLSWHYVVKEDTEETSAGPEEGVYVTGLFLEGAKWDSVSNSLTEPESMELYSSMPLIHFKPIESRRKCQTDAYHCPVYMSPVRSGTPQRPSFIIAVDLDSGDKATDHWTKRGVSLLLSTAE